MKEMYIKSRVIPGKGKGKTIGFPTLNLEIPDGFAEPHGIYAGWVRIGNTQYKAAFHWGPVPVFGIANPSLEAHLLNVSLVHAPAGDIHFRFVKRLRDIQSFSSSEALARQIQKDVEKTEESL